MSVSAREPERIRFAAGERTLDPALTAS
jgi:hypothetical protein